MRERYQRRTISTAERAGRVVWGVCWLLLCRWTPNPAHAWRAVVLRAFGARLGRGCHVYPSARVWAPWRLEMADGACLGPGVDCYNVDWVRMGRDSIVSQDAYICTASHEYRTAEFALITAPVEMGAGAWVAARAMVGPGVRIGDDAVVGMGAVVREDVKVGVVVAGNPAAVVSEQGRRREVR